MDERSNPRNCFLGKICRRIYCIFHSPSKMGGWPSNCGLGILADHGINDCKYTYNFGFHIDEPMDSGILAYQTKPGSRIQPKIWVQGAVRFQPGVQPLKSLMTSKMLSSSIFDSSGDSIVVLPNVSRHHVARHVAVFLSCFRAQQDCTVHSLRFLATLSTINDGQAALTANLLISAHNWNIAMCRLPRANRNAILAPAWTPIQRHRPVEGHRHALFIAKSSCVFVGLWLWLRMILRMILGMILRMIKMRYF